MTKVFIFAGQSNAQGYGNRTQLSPVPAWAQNAANGWTGAPTVSSDTGVQYAHPTLTDAPSLYNENGTGLMAGVYDAWGSYDGESPKYPGGAIGEIGSYGPELSFLDRYRSDHPGEQIAVIKCVLGGSSIVEWLPGANMWNVLKAHIDGAKGRLVAAGKAIEWAGFVWMQGESGAASVWPYLHPTAGQEYSDQLRALLAAVRGQTTSDLPVVIGRIGNHLLADNIINPLVNASSTADQLRGATNYRRAQQAIVGADARNALADTDGLPVLQVGDPQYWYHHTGAGYLAMGERFYAAWQQAQGETPPPPPPALVVKFNGAVQAWTVSLNGTGVGKPGDVIEITG